MEYARGYIPQTQRQQNRYSRNNNITDDIYSSNNNPFSSSSSSNNNNNNEVEYELAITQLRTFAQILLSTSLFFWCWAQYNTYTMRQSAAAAAAAEKKDGGDANNTGGGGGYDLGIYSFACSGVSSLYILCRYTGFKTQSILNNAQKRNKKRGGNDDNTLDYLLTNNNSSSQNESNEQKEEEEIMSNYYLPPPMPNKIMQLLISLTHVIVMANYLLGLLFALTVNGKHIYIKFALYCFSFAILWGCVTVYGWKVMVRVRNWGNAIWSERQQGGDDEADDGEDEEDEVEALLGGKGIGSGRGRGVESRYFEGEDDDEDDYIYSLGAGRGNGRGGLRSQY